MGATDKEISIEDMAVFCKKKGFIFPNSEIYGGMAGLFDYGPLGAELKNNIKNSWWKRFVHDREDIVGIDGAILSHPRIWAASGHASHFAELVLICSKCGAKYRADHFISEQLKINADGIKADKINELIGKFKLKCLKCKGEFKELIELNLMFKTYFGPVEDDKSITYLRPETAQLIFADFKAVYETSRMKLPFGICQSGKAFRNEISPRDFLFRSREFEQMEIEYFIHPDKEKCRQLNDSILNFEFNILNREIQEKRKEYIKLKAKEMLHKKMLGEWHAYWLYEVYSWFIELGISPDNLRLREHLPNELAHYSKACFDIEYRFPFGWREVHGCADRGQFDLKQHQSHSGKSMEIFDEETKKKIIPRVVEPSQGTDRALLAVMFEAYNYDEKRGNVVLKLDRKIAPFKIAVFPLVSNKEEIVKKAREVYMKLKKCFCCFYDSSGSVGRRYARQDEIGTPLCITIDFQTLEDSTATIRNRDTTQQIRVNINELNNLIIDFLNGKKLETLGKIV